MTTTAAVDPNKWYTLGQAAKLLPYSRGQLRTRLKLGQIKHEVNAPLKEGGRPTYKIRGDEVLRLGGAAILANQPLKAEPVAKRIKQFFRRMKAKK